MGDPNELTDAPPYAVPAPFEPDQIAKLNALQRAGRVQVFMHRTDDHRATLEATRDGWVCPVEDCGYLRAWTPHWTLWNLATPGIPYPEPRELRHGDPIGVPGIIARIRARVSAAQQREQDHARQVAHLEGRIKGLIKHAQAQHRTITEQNEEISALMHHNDATCDVVQERDSLRLALRETVALLRGHAGVAA